MKNFKSFILTNTLGTFLDYLDATLYAFFATIIAADFFPEKNPRTSLLLSLGVFAIAFIVRPFGALLFGYLGDRYTLSRILIGATLSMGVVALSLFYLIIGAHFGITLAAFGVLAIITGAFDGPLAAYLVTKFDVSVRHSGVSLSYNLGAALLGGMTPLALTYFIDKTKLAIFPSFPLIGFSLLAFYVLLKDKKNYDLTASHY